MHFAASCHNFLVLESFIIDVPWRRDISTEDFKFEDGCYVVPDKPGLGVDLCEDVFEKYPYRTHEFRHYTGKLTDIRPPDFAALVLSAQLRRDNVILRCRT